MADLSSSPAPPKTRRDDTLELDADLERMTEDVENMSVQLSWMTYDMVELRTRPELALRMRELEEAYRRCRDAVYGEACQVTPQQPGQEPCLELPQEPDSDPCPGTAAKQHT
ncbi:synaptonemal complex central element protein 3 [Cololabis saira]|uniref:synaptonemal complex central element protein 3 n=1 Tax=Cololabis saira TaxID=129043 RepID=UPI002AD4D7E4|nr:synaptonemal complex central element protein 3 [Cololabis saira]